MAITQNVAFFVTPEFIFQKYAMYLDNNLDPNSMNSAILLAQAQETQQLLGYTLYTKYISMITVEIATPGATGSINNSENVNYKQLLDNYIVDSVSLWSIAKALKPIHLRSTNKSVVTKSSPPNSAAISNKDLSSLYYKIIEDAQFWDTRVVEQIINFPFNFPEYYQTTGVMRMVPKKNTYDNFFITGKTYGGAGSGFPQGNPCNGCGGYIPGVGLSMWGS